MMQLTPEIIHDRDQWNTMLAAFPNGHVLQTWEWGTFKRETTGWAPERICFLHQGQPAALASVQTRSIGPVKVMYVPRGPAMDYANPTLTEAVLAHLEQHARSKHAIWLKIDPAITIGTGVPGEPDEQDDPDGLAFRSLLQRRGWCFSDSQIQFRNTIALDLTLSEDDLLAAMSQNTRRKIRTGEKKGVTIREATGDDLGTLYRLYRITGERDHFLIRPPDYYQKAWRDFMEAGLAHALIAEAEGQPIAHVILFHFAQTCWYFYGASSNEARERMPNYALQWAAMRWAKAHGYHVYDMWGAPDEFSEADRMWGVYQFKRGFRGAVVRTIGAWDYAPYPPLYQVYTRLWPRVLDWLRRRE